MKKLLALCVVLALALTFAPAAVAADVCRSSQKLTVDGKAADCSAYNIDGYNYFRLRDLAALFGGTDSTFDVTYDSAANAVVVTTGAAYAAAAVGALPAEEDLSASAVKSAQSVIVDGKTVTELSVYNIGGSNWFKLAELQTHLGYTLGYDAATRTAAITTGAAQPAANAADYQEIYAAISRLRGGASGAVPAEETAAADAAVDAPAAAPEPTAANDALKDDGADYSGTNVQVDGFDEADIVKTDGKNIYVLRDGRELLILKAAGAATEIVSRTALGMDRDEVDKTDEHYVYESKSARDMYVADGRVMVLSEYYYSENYKEASGWHYESSNYACIDIYDVSDPAAPQLLSALGQDGYIMESRMADGKVYVVSNYWVRSGSCDEAVPATYVPGLYRNGVVTTLPADCIIIAPECDSTEYVVVCSYDLQTAATQDTLSLLGGGDTLYMNDGGLYVMHSKWTNTVTKTYQESIYEVTEHLDASETEIFRFDAADGAIRFSGSGSVPGYVDGQFSADEYQGYLRLVTTRDESRYRIYSDKSYGFENYQWDENTRSNGLYILDSALNVVGSVADLAPDERVYSARFDGDIAYFCTYRQTDPLFAVDVSNPAAPKVLSALKISGFSEYLHGWGADRLFGFGRETNEETGWSEGLKLVMFNTADKADVTVADYLVLDSDYSEALYNHRAFFIDSAKNIIGFLGEDQYYVYAYDADGGFRQLCSFGFDGDEWNVRGLYIGDYAYIVGQNQLRVLDLGAWQSVAALQYGA